MESFQTPPPLGTKVFKISFGNKFWNNFGLVIPPKVLMLNYGDSWIHPYCVCYTYAIALACLFPVILPIRGTSSGMRKIKNPDNKWGT